MPAHWSSSCFQLAFVLLLKNNNNKEPKRRQYNLYTCKSAASQHVPGRTPQGCGDAPTSSPGIWEGNKPFPTDHTSAHRLSTSYRISPSPAPQALAVRGDNPQPGLSPAAFPGLTEQGSLTLTAEQKSTPSPKVTSGHSLGSLPWGLLNTHLFNPKAVRYDLKRGRGGV